MTLILPQPFGNFALGCGGGLEDDADGLAEGLAAATGMAASRALGDGLQVTRTVDGEVAVPSARRGVRFRTSPPVLIITVPELPAMAATAVAGSASRTLPVAGSGTAVEVCASHCAVADRPCSVTRVLSAPVPSTVVAPSRRRPVTAACGRAAVIFAAVGWIFWPTIAAAGKVAATTTLTASLPDGKLSAGNWQRYVRSTDAVVVPVPGAPAAIPAVPASTPTTSTSAPMSTDHRVDPPEPPALLTRG